MKKPVNLITELNNRLKNVQLKNKGLFFWSLSPIHHLMKNLNLSNYMNVNDLRTAIHYIEQIDVIAANQKIKLSEILEQRYRNRTMTKAEGSLAAQTKSIRIESEEIKLINVLANIHRFLIDYFEVGSTQLKGESPAFKLTYSEAMLNKSQAVLDIETSSKAAETGDKVNVIFDARRKGTLFEGKIIEGSDREIISYLEDFADSEYDKLGSRANKIYNFGHQILPAIILQEFIDTTRLVGQEEEIEVHPSRTRATVDWKKTEDGEIYAEVKISIYSCRYIDKTTFDMKMVVISSDGRSLQPLTDDEMELFKKGNTDYIVPICTIHTRIGFIQDQENLEYSLKVEELQLAYNTPDLVSIHAPDYQQSSSFNFR